MNQINTSLLVIGGGPGGYVAAIRAGQLGIPTVLVEADSLGGTCLNVGCVPSKALIHAAGEYAAALSHTADSPLGIRVQSPSIDLRATQKWKDGIVGKLTGGVGALLKKNGVKVVKGWARIVDGKTVDVDISEENAALRIQCEHLLLATGSQPVALPGMPFGGDVISSTEALALDELPRHLVIVGAGYIGLECGMAWRKLGSEVAVVETAGRILPTYDEELARPVQASLQRQGITLHLECQAQGLAESGGVRVRSGNADEYVLPADKVLVAVGRRARTTGFNLEGLSLAMVGSALRVDDQCRTSMRNVWAIGDLTGEPMLAHRAMAQGEMVAEIISGKRRHFSPTAIPAVCFTDPEVVSAGLTAAQAQGQGIDCGATSFPFSANGRAMTLESTDGFVRVVWRKDTHLILGWQAVGRGVSELAAAFTYAIEMGSRLEDVGAIIHAHPTLGEAVQEAALRGLGHALHI